MRINFVAMIKTSRKIILETETAERLMTVVSVYEPVRKEIMLSLRKM